ncbi:unnamed protein product [Meloidogyne enterolobii]|uniref:Uncharacterized protein n=1 Tax=Meloidogyne enterolobii TaxID=390850 RepID=A0ACB0YD52_MELEN
MASNYNTKNTKITSSDGQQQRKAELERRRSIRTIIASYEAEEEAFLKELEKMQAECEEENLNKLNNNQTLNSSNEKQKLIENEEQQPAVMLGFVFEII